MFQLYICVHNLIINHSKYKRMDSLMNKEELAKKLYSLFTKSYFDKINILNIKR